MASAAKPSPVSSRAVPASHGLGTTKGSVGGVQCEELLRLAALVGGVQCEELLRLAALVGGGVGHGGLPRGRVTVV